MIAITPMLAIDFEAGLDDAWNDIAAFVPRFVAFLVVLVVGWILARVLARLADRLLERVGFDRAVERGGVGRALEHTRFDASDLLAKVIYYALLLLVVQLAFGVFGNNPVSDLIAGAVRYLPAVAAAIIIIVVAAAVASLVRELVDGALAASESGAAVANLVSGAVIAVGVFAALDQLDIAPDIVRGLFTAVLAVIVGVVVVAVGGGGIAPMRQRWERGLDRYDRERAGLRGGRRRAPRGSGTTDEVHAGTAEHDIERTRPPVGPSPFPGEGPTSAGGPGPFGT